LFKKLRGRPKAVPESGAAPGIDVFCISMNERRIPGPYYTNFAEHYALFVALSGLGGRRRRRGGSNSHFGNSSLKSEARNPNPEARIRELAGRPAPHASVSAFGFRNWAAGQPSK
jgi:hypothetical protein